MSKFAERLKAERMRNGMNQEQLARAISINMRQLSRYECGTSEPTLSKLLALADVLNVSLDYLAGRTDDPRTHFLDSCDNCL